MSERDAPALLEAALLRLMERRPFSSVTVADLIREAGVNRSTFYYHYCDKYALRQSILERLLGRLRCSVPLQQGCFQPPQAPDIARTVAQLHAQKELFLRLISPNWELDTLALARSCFNGLALEWAKAQPDPGYDPALFADLYAASALATVMWSLQGDVSAEDTAAMISDHLRRGFFRAFTEPSAAQ